jgi:hypothetical protein
MLKHDDCIKNAAVKHRANPPADKVHLLALAERGFRPADQLDYMVRRWVIPIPEVSRSGAPTPPSRRSLPRKHSRGVSRSTLRETSMRSNGLLGEVQVAIAQHLRAEYDLTQPIPARLVDLLRELDGNETGYQRH